MTTTMTTHYDNFGRAITTASMDERNMALLLTVYGKVSTLPAVMDVVPLLERYPRDPKLDANVGARIPESMKQKARDVKETYGLSQADLVRIGLAEVFKRVEQGKDPRVTTGRNGKRARTWRNRRKT